MERRVFLKSGAFALVTMGLSPSFLRRTVFAADLGRATRKGKILICLFQRGAADALNIVVPHGEAAYYALRPNIGIAIFDARADIEHLGPGGDNGAGPCLRASPHDGPASLVSGCATLWCGHTGCVPVPRRWFGRPVSRWESGFALVGRVLTRRARGCRACASFRHEGPALASGCRAAS